MTKLALSEPEDSECASQPVPKPKETNSVLGHNSRNFICFQLFVISYCKMDCRNGTSIRTPMAWCANAGHHLDDRTTREWSVNDQ